MQPIRIAGGAAKAQAILVERLIAAANTERRTVSVIAEQQRGFDFDTPGKDSHRHREAGARSVAVLSTQHWAVMYEAAQPARPRLADLLAHLVDADLVLVLGFEDAKALPVLRIEGEAVLNDQGAQISLNDVPGWSRYLRDHAHSQPDFG
jgi:molybdopterin-guanine dinucleotide biosynthesis protein B